MVKRNYGFEKRQKELAKKKKKEEKQKKKLEKKQTAQIDEAGDFSGVTDTDTAGEPE